MLAFTFETHTVLENLLSIEKPIKWRRHHALVINLIDCISPFSVEFPKVLESVPPIIMINLPPQRDKNM